MRNAIEPLEVIRMRSMLCGVNKEASLFTREQDYCFLLRGHSGNCHTFDSHGRVMGGWQPNSSNLTEDDTVIQSILRILKETLFDGRHAGKP